MRIGSFTLLYIGAQLLAQLANILSGFVVVREMTKADYAWFTVVNSSLAMISVLADSGLGSAFNSIGGKTIEQPQAFSAVASYVRRKRLLFLSVAAMIAIPSAIWALSKNGTPVLTLGLLCTMILLGAIPATDSVVLTTVNKLHRKVKNIVTADLVLSLGKLSLILLVFVGVGSLTATSTTACMVLAVWIQLFVLRYQTRAQLPPSVEDVSQYHRSIHETVKHVLPTCIFTCFQAQIAVYLLSYFSDTSEVADLGALNRLAVAFTFLSLPLNQVFLPLISRCQSADKLFQLIVNCMVGCIAASIALIAIAYVFSNELLSLLGTQYTHLQVEMVLFMAVTAIGFLGNSIWGVVFAKSWVGGGWLNIPLTLLLQLIAIPFLNFSHVTGVILFSAVSHVALLSTGVWLVVKGFRSEVLELTKPVAKDS